jgi:hypothetical protein
MAHGEKKADVLGLIERLLDTPRFTVDFGEIDRYGVWMHAVIEARMYVARCRAGTAPKQTGNQRAEAVEKLLGRIVSPDLIHDLADEGARARLALAAAGIRVTPDEKFTAPRAEDCGYGCCKAGDEGIGSEVIEREERFKVTNKIGGTGYYDANGRTVEEMWDAFGGRRGPSAPKAIELEWRMVGPWQSTPIVEVAACTPNTLGIVMRSSPDQPFSPGYIGDLEELRAAGYEARPLHGGVVSAEDFPELHAALRGVYGTYGDTFKLPDFRGRVV